MGAQGHVDMRLWVGHVLSKGVSRGRVRYGDQHTQIVLTCSEQRESEVWGSTHSQIVLTWSEQRESEVWGSDSSYM